MARTIGAQTYMECSAFTGDGMEKLFAVAAQLCLEMKKKKGGTFQKLKKLLGG